MYSCWSTSGYPQEVPIRVFGKEPSEWLNLPRDIPNVVRQEFETFHEVYKWLESITLNFSYGDFVNWPVIVRDIERNIARSGYLFQPSGKLFGFCIIPYEKPVFQNTQTYSHQ